MKPAKIVLVLVLNILCFQLLYADESKRFTLDKKVIVAGKYETLTFTYTVGKDGIAVGGGIKFKIQDHWFDQYLDFPQSTDPSKPGYITTSTTGRGNVKAEAYGIQGTADVRENQHITKQIDRSWYAKILDMLVKVVDSPLQEGDKITLIYGDRSKGSPGAVVATVTQVNSWFDLYIDKE